MINASRLAAFAAAVAVTFAFAPVADARSVVPGKPGAHNIVEIAIKVNDGGKGEFNYLLAAATCPQLEGAVFALLTGADKYTLFAPSDAAFIALQQALITKFNLTGVTPSPGLTCAVDDLLGEGTLFQILAYHVTEGRRFSNSVFNRKAPKMIEMLNGQYIVANPNFTLSDGAGQTVGIVPRIGSISTVNVNASNGVIHTINKVLLPFAP